MDDRSIVDLFFERKEEALEEVKKKYARLYAALIRRTLKSASDAEECEQDLLLALWSSIPPQKPENLPAYILTLARRIAAGKARAALRQKRAENLTVLLSELEDCIPDDRSVENALEEKELEKAINDFLSSLPARDRVLFLRRFFYGEEVSSLAERFGLRENAVSVCLYRSKKKLKKLLEKKGICL